jgi:predicted nuclease with TOPRIM domain
MGVMAQELEKIFPELVRTAQDEMGTKSVNYVGMIAPLIEASKSLKAENDTLKAQVDKLKGEQSAMNDNFKTLANDVEGLKAHTNYGVDKAQFGLTEAGIMIGAGAFGGAAVVMFSRRRKKTA